MGLSTMTPEGELRIPMQGSPSPEVLDRLEFLENTAASLQQEINELKGSIAGESYGLVKLSDRTDITDASGIALSARQNNPSIKDTLANIIQSVKQTMDTSILDNVRFLGRLGGLDSEIGSVAANNNIPDHVIYAFVQVPKTGKPYIQGGGSHIVIGMEYGNHKYGNQLSLGASVKRRTLQDGSWYEWETIQTV